VSPENPKTGEMWEGRGGGSYVRTEKIQSGLEPFASNKKEQGKTGIGVKGEKGHRNNRLKKSALWIKKGTGEDKCMGRGLATRNLEIELVELAKTGRGGGEKSSLSSGPRWREGKRRTPVPLQSAR